MAKHLSKLKTVPRRRRRRAAASFASMLFAGLGGCAAGVDFVSPPPPQVSCYTPEPLTKIGGERLGHPPGTFPNAGGKFSTTKI